MRFFLSNLACIGTLVLAACSTTKTLVVLLPEESGTSGAVAVGEGPRAVVLDAPLTSATVDSRGNIGKAPVTQEEVQRTFGAALASAGLPSPESATSISVPLARILPRNPNRYWKRYLRRSLSVKPLRCR